MCGSIIGNQRGAAAITLAIIIVFCLMTLSGALALLTTTGYKGYNQSAGRAQALYVAEAGVSAAVREIRDSQDYDSNGTVGGISSVSLYDGDGLTIGEYAVTRSGSNPYTLTSAGTRYGTTKTITAAVSGIALFAGGDIDFKKETINVNGHIYANNKIYYRNSSAVTLDGNANANNTITGTPSSITGYSNIGVADINPLPDLDFDYWKSEAISSGTYYDNDKEFNDETFSGVVYVDGEAIIAMNKTLTINNGCLVASGRIWGKKNSSITITHTSAESIAYPALAAENDVIVWGGASLTGLVYSLQNISLNPQQANNNITIQGVAVAGGDITFNSTNPNNVITVSHQLGAYQGFKPSGILGIALVGGSWSEE